MPTTTVTLTFVSQPGNESGAWSGSPSLAAALAVIGSTEALAAGGAGAEATLNLQLQASLPADATNIRVYFIAWCRVPVLYAVVSLTLGCLGVSLGAVNQSRTDQQPVYFGTSGANTFALTRADIVAGVPVTFIANDVVDFSLELYLDGIQAIIDYDVGGATPSTATSRLSLAASLGL